MTPFIQNNNNGGGTLNAVHGNQLNSSQLALQTTTTIHVASSSPVLVDAISTGVSQLLKDFRSDPLNVLLIDTGGLSDFLGFVEGVLAIIDDIPDLRSLQLFERVRKVVETCRARLYNILGDILAYQAELHDTFTSEFINGLVLRAYAHIKWAPQFWEIRGFVRNQRTILGRFFNFLSTRSWRSLISTEHHHRQLERLIIEMNLQPDPSLRYLATLKIVLRDHLGRLFPIPMEFCSSWQDLEIVVKHYCRDTPGSRYISQNAWELTLAENNRVVEQSNFASIVKPEVQFNVSIVLECRYGDANGMAFKKPRSMPRVGRKREIN